MNFATVIDFKCCYDNNIQMSVVAHVPLVLISNLTYRSWVLVKTASMLQMKNGTKMRKIMYTSVKPILLYLIRVRGVYVGIMINKSVLTPKHFSKGKYRLPQPKYCKHNTEADTYYKQQ